MSIYDKIGEPICSHISTKGADDLLHVVHLPANDVLLSTSNGSVPISSLLPYAVRNLAPVIVCDESDAPEPEYEATETLISRKAGFSVRFFSSSTSDHDAADVIRDIYDGEAVSLADYTITKALNGATSVTLILGRNMKYARPDDNPETVTRMTSITKTFIISVDSSVRSTHLYGYAGSGDVNVPWRGWSADLSWTFSGGSIQLSISNLRLFTQAAAELMYAWEKRPTSAGIYFEGQRLDGSNYYSEFADMGCLTALATSESKGLMSSADKVKLDGLSQLPRITKIATENTNTGQIEPLSKTVDVDTDFASTLILHGGRGINAYIGQRGAGFGQKYITTITLGTNPTEFCGDGLRVSAQGIVSVPEYGGASASATGTSGLVPAALSAERGLFLRGDGEWAAPADYQGATAQADGVAGLVPAAATEERAFFLRGDGEWAEVPDLTSISITLQTADGSTDTTADVDLTQDFTLDVPDHTHPAGNITGLATVATSGSYNDLADKPTIPSAVTDVVKKSTSNQVEVDEFLFRNVTTGYLRIGGGTSRSTGANIKLYGKDDVTHPGRVDFQAYDGSYYSTLKFEPTETRPTFYWLNSLGSGTEQIAYLTDIPTVPNLSKGTTTGSGNAVTDISVSGHQITLTKGSSFVPISRTVNSKALSANITLTASDVGALSDSTIIPSKTSDLTNDSGFLTAQDISGKADVSALANYLPLAGGTLTGDLFRTSSNNRSISIGTLNSSGSTIFYDDFYFGWPGNTGARLHVFGTDAANYAGGFSLRTHNGTNMLALIGRPSATLAGSLTWGSKAVETVYASSYANSSGYIRYSNGLQLVWGQTAALSAATAVTFAAAFAHVPIVITTSNKAVATYVTGPSTTGFNAAAANYSNSPQIRYIAIGDWS